MQYERSLTIGDNQYMANIGTKIRDAREAHGWTQDELADRAGVTQGAVGHLESGRTKRPQKLPEIARALGVTVEWLTDEESDVPFDVWNAAHGVQAPPNQGSYEPDMMFSLEGVSGEMRTIIVELKNIDKIDDARRRMLVASIGAMLASSEPPRRRR